MADAPKNKYYFTSIVMLALLQESKTLTCTTTLRYLYLYIHTLGDWIHTHFTCQDLVWPEKNESTCRELWENLATPSEVCLVWDDSQWVSNSRCDGWSKGQTTFSVLHNPQGFKWQSVVAKKKTQCCYSSAFRAVKTDRSAYLCVTT